MAVLLSGAVLSGAVLRGADTATDEESIVNLDKVREIIIDDEKRLEMGHWHADESWKDRTCAEEAVCGTTHCLAGWLQVCSTNPEVKKLSPQTAGIVMAPVATKMFFRSGDKVLEWLKNRTYVADIEENRSRKAAREARKQQS